MLKIGPQSEDTNDRLRRLEFNGIKYIMKAHDPYGFWKITCLKINKTLEGQYTSLSEATKAAQIHSNSLGK